MDAAVLLFWAVLVIGLQVWLYKAAPPKTFVQKYSWRVLFLSMLPLVTTWKARIELADTETVQKYRKRAAVYLFILVLSLILVCTYFYLRYLKEVGEIGGGG